MPRILFCLFVLMSWGVAAPAAAEDKEGKPSPGDPLPGRENAERGDPQFLTPMIRGRDLIVRSREAMARGFEHLRKTQNKDGTWGSHHPKLTKLKNFGFKTGNRGSQDGVRAACTAIAATAYLRIQKRTEAQESVYQRALSALLGTEKFAYERGEAFNTWGYGYKLLFLAEFLERTTDPALRKKATAAADVCVKGLRRFQLVDGGWNYYAGPLLGGTSMSFNTGNFIVALQRAQAQGVGVPKGLIGDAAKLLRRMRTIRGGFVYDARFLNAARSVNELSTAARTVAAEEALAILGQSSPQHLARTRLVFAEGENWLEDGRKLITPHTAVHQVSGYFFFFGYYWFAELLQRFDDVPLRRWERMAWTMLRTQEDGGEWWDTAAADYGDKWGTGFALCVLQRALAVLEPVSAGTVAESKKQGAEDEPPKKKPAARGATEDKALEGGK